VYGKSLGLEEYMVLNVAKVTHYSYYSTRKILLLFSDTEPGFHDGLDVLSKSYLILKN